MMSWNFSITPANYFSFTDFSQSIEAMSHDVLKSAEKMENIRNEFQKPLDEALKQCLKFGETVDKKIQNNTITQKDADDFNNVFYITSTLQKTTSNIIEQMFKLIKSEQSAKTEKFTKEVEILCYNRLVEIKFLNSQLMTAQLQQSGEVYREIQEKTVKLDIEAQQFDFMMQSALLKEAKIEQNFQNDLNFRKITHEMQ